MMTMNETREDAIQWIQGYFSLAFFGFSAFFVVFSLLLLVLRSRPWCNCHVCRGYLGSTWSLEFKNLCDWYAHLLRSSPTGTIHVHVINNVITANPANVEHMLRTRFDNFPKGRPFAVILGDFLGRGIFNADGETWFFQRKLASLELGSSAVRSHAFKSVSAEIRQRLLPLLDAHQTTTLDLQDVFRRFAFDTICKISFGLDPGCLDLSLPISKFAAAFDAASQLSARRAVSPAPIMWRIKRMLNVGSEKELRSAIKLVNALADEVIRQRRKIGFSAHHDLLSRFMGSVDDDKYLRDIVISFLLAGRDTVASGLSGFFLLLSQHSTVREKILRDISDSGSTDSELPSFEQLQGMHYVHAAIYESLRLYPPVQFDSKFCLDDDMFPDGTFLRKGTRVTYHPYSMGRMESLWGSDYENFRPERWMRDGVFVPVSPYKYPVFQGGARVCLGKEMAVMQMKAVVVSVVREFDIKVIDADRSPRFAPGLTASFSGGLPARVTRRR